MRRGGWLKKVLPPRDSERPGGLPPKAPTRLVLDGEDAVGYTLTRERGKVDSRDFNDWLRRGPRVIAEQDRTRFDRVIAATAEALSVKHRGARRDEFLRVVMWLSERDILLADQGDQEGVALEAPSLTELAEEYADTYAFLPELAEDVQTREEQVS